MRPLRLAFVVVRYGEGVLGGAEAHCRAVVERLAARGHDVRVLTTTARSYKSWRSELPAGEDRVGGIRVTRFPTVTPRLIPADEILKAAVTLSRQGTHGLARLAQFDRWSRPRQKAHEVLENAWIRAQGPLAPKLVDALAQVDADAFVFFGYLYYPTIFGLPTVRERAMVAPLADEEPMLYAPIVRKTLRLPRALLLNVDEEAERVKAIVSPEAPPMAVVALGIDPPPPPAPYPRPTDDPFVLVLGRAGKTKPMAAVWRALTAMKDVGTIELDDGRVVDASRLQLVTAGEHSRHLEGLPRVHQLGRVDEATRWGLVRDALALVSPSESESLSLVVLEAWLASRCCIVNRACDATDGHVRRCGGGVSIAFEPAGDAAAAVLEAIRSRSFRDGRAALGKAYVERRYAWDAVLDAYESIATAIADRGDVDEAVRGFGGRTGAWILHGRRP